MKLTKEQFCDAVDTYKKMCDEEDKIREVLDVGFEWTPSQWIGAYYALLTQMCELEDDILYGNDLDYFCYDLNFGQKWEPGMIMIDGEDIPCRNVEELWDMITKE